MPLSVLIPALLLGLCALVIILFIVKIFLGALSFKPREMLLRWRMKQFASLVGNADRLISEEKYADALRVLRSAFFLEHVRSSRRAIDSSYSHNLSVLERVVLCSQARGRRSSALAVVEELFAARVEMMSTYRNLLDTRAKVGKRQEEKGHKMPSWGREELEAKLRAVRDEIFTNKQALKSKLRELFDELDGTPAEKEITYH